MITNVSDLDLDVRLRWYSKDSTITVEVELSNRFTGNRIREQEPVEDIEPNPEAAVASALLSAAARLLGRASSREAAE